MMTWNEREAYKSIAQMCEEKLARCKKEYEEYEADCLEDPFLNPTHLILLDGEITAYEDIVYEITKILGGDK